MKKHLLLASFLLFAIKNYATCPQTEVIVYIVPDGFAYETSWNITDSSGNIIASGDTAQGDTVCIPNGSCHIFSIFDSYGDGIATPGGYWLYVNGTLVSSGNAFGSGAQIPFNCPQGIFCNDPIPLTFGTHTGQFEDTWYDYTPPISGIYKINTCGLDSCDTKIWIYQNCPSMPYNNGVQGTYSYNDDNNCGTQAVLNVILSAGTHYLIRIGDNSNACTGSITFDFSYVGPVYGCTDINACNYNSFAMVDDSSCIYFPNPACAGPDLQIDSSVFVSSLSIQTETAALCDVDEGCLLGYGTRYVIAFSSKINNVGTLDFFIGNPATQPSMFNTFNCHGHAHYEGYGDYRLYDSLNNLIPVGHKNGFCVLDLCGTGQYTCSNMGISVGCYDEYTSGLQCQWVDITDVPTGDYRLAVIINSKHLPDAYGHTETNYINNALQVCIHINHNSAGAPTFTLLPNCTPYVDCMGIRGGNAELDCNGICNGTGIYGDVFQDSRIDSEDVYTYMDMIQLNLPASRCNDLDGDSSLSVYDAQLLNWCMHGNNSHVGGSSHNHCYFPRNVVNPNDLTGLSISNVDFVNNYIDINILNPAAKVKAYEFTMSGITISSVVSLANPVDYPVDVRYRAGDNLVFAVSLEDSALQRSPVFQPLVRIYFSAVTDTQICISSIKDIINQDAEKTVTNVLGSCFTSVQTTVPAIMKHADLVLLPNPARDKAYLHLSVNAGNIDELTIMDLSGKVFNVPKQPVKESWYELDLRNLPSGIYIVSLRNNNAYGITRFVKL